MEFRIPEVYVLNRRVSPDRVPSVLSSLGITPLHTVFITDDLDFELAVQFSSPIDIFKTKSEAEAIVLGHSVYQETTMPCLVIGEAVLLDGIYSDDSRETVNVR